MTVFDLKTESESIKQDIRDALDKSHEWKEESPEYANGIIYQFRILKDKDMYNVEVSLNDFKLGGCVGNIDLAFLLLDSLQNALSNFRIAISSSQAQSPHRFFDRQSKNEVTLENIRTIVGKENIWEGNSDEWQPGLSCYFRLIRNENDGYTTGFNVFAKAGKTSMSAIALPTMHDAFATMMSYHSTLRRCAKI